MFPIKQPASLGSLLLILIAIGCTQSELPPSELLERGKYLSDKERPAEAITYFDRALELQPTNPELFYLRGLAKERTDNLTGAIEDYGRAIALKSSYSEAYNNRAVLHARQGSFEKAIADFSKVLTFAPNFTLGYKNRGLALHDLGRHEAALEDYNRAIELEPDSQGYFLRGNLRLEQKAYAQAVADYDEALKLDDLNARVWLNRGVALSYLGDSLGARENLQRAAATDNSLVTIDVLKALQRITATPSIYVKLPQDTVATTLAAKGWTVAAHDDPNFPFLITKESETKKLCVAVVEADEGKITVPARFAKALTDEKSPKSLLVFIPGDGKAKDTWQFSESWNPEPADLEIATIDILLASEGPPVPE